MKKASAKSLDDDLRPEYDLSKLKGGVRGKHYQQAAAGTNLMLIEPELAKVFGDALKTGARLMRPSLDARTLRAPAWLVHQHQRD